MTKATKMLKHYDNFLDSGLTRKNYCEKHNINVHTFKYWQCKLDSKAKSSFLTVEIPKKTEPISSILQLEIQYPNGVKIKSGLDFEIIRQLISLV
jgi:hypothetical protein